MQKNCCPCVSVLCAGDSQGVMKFVLAGSCHVLFALHFFLILFVFLCSGERFDCDMGKDMRRDIAYFSRLTSLTEQWWNDI